MIEVVDYIDGVLANKSFRVCSKFNGIKKHQRIAFLRKMLQKGETISLEQMKVHRGQLDSHKVPSLPMSENCTCYVCGNKAVLRHHVIPLSRGGRNKRNNIVPLCNNCHYKVHPHLHKKPKKFSVANSFAVLRSSKNNGPLSTDTKNISLVLQPV